MALDALIQEGSRTGAASLHPNAASEQTSQGLSLSAPLKAIIEGLCAIGLGTLAKRLVTSAIDPSGGAIAELAPKAVMLLLAIAGMASGRKPKETELPSPPFEADLEKLFAIPELESALGLRENFGNMLMSEAPGKESWSARLRSLLHLKPRGESEATKALRGGIMGGKDAWNPGPLAAGKAPETTDNVDTVEINTFGDQPRTAILYREADGRIRDWRWFSHKSQIPQPVGDGRHVAIWDDQGKPRTVYCKSVRYTRTREDLELVERDVELKRRPRHIRRGLSK